MKMNAGILQDLFHYALAIQGNHSSAFPCGNLRQRLQASDAAYLALTGLEAAPDWEAYIPIDWKSESDMLAYGLRLQAKICEVAAFCSVDPRTGEAF